MTIENRSASAAETWLGEASAASKIDPITAAANAWRARDRATACYSHTSSARASAATHRCGSNSPALTKATRPFMFAIPQIAAQTAKTDHHSHLFDHRVG